MKVLLVAPQPFYQERGTPIAVRLLAETLCDLGHDVDLLVYHAGEDIAYPRLRLFRAGRPPGVTQIPIGFSPQKLICDVWLIVRMVGLLLRNRYDVVHAVEEAVFPAALLRLLSRGRMVYDMDSSMADQLIDKWPALRRLEGAMAFIERLAVRRADAVLAVCEDLAAKVRPWVGDARVTVLPDVPMGDPDVERPVDSLRTVVGPGRIIGLYVGNLERYQGIDLLFDALAQVPAAVPFSAVVIGGSAAHIGIYRARAQELGIGDRVHLLGPRPVSDLVAYLRQADVLLSPRTLGQNTPMKVYSYMQSGRAILATDIRSHTQALDADCAALVAPEPLAMAAGLRRLIDDPALRERLGTAARAKAEREYSLPVFRRKLQHAYERLARA